MTTIVTDDIMIKNEQEAAVAILLSCLNHHQRQVQKQRLEHVSRMLLLSSKFHGLSLADLAGNALPLINSYQNEQVMQFCAPMISDSFKETLFAMICELLTSTGELAEKESKIVGLAALYLGISIDMMRVIISTFLIRNRWNV